ncbi:hypothetical protein H5410_002102 [Solanum commersonii]|uniref:Uncharacterized protein n=1 Tax=Solanum commersonii TaxID=4109 RepID=A0A9J6B113_SOLCO|nr:hypothetical protein H5410_002102 [Solanum commersonii]
METKKIEKKLRRAYGHYAKDRRVKEKIKNLDIDDNLKDSRFIRSCLIPLNRSYSTGNIQSTSEDLKALQQKNIRLRMTMLAMPTRNGMRKR